VVEILSVGVDITDRKRAEQALSLAKEAAEAASRAKSEFLSLMSHELRTPLTSILGFAEVIARDAALSAEHQDYLDIIRESGTHLLHLINSVLEMSKIEAGELVLTPKPFDLHRLLDNLYALFHLKASSKGLTLRLQQADLPRYLCADAEKLHQVVSNLLENAIKFTNTGSVVLRFNIQHIEEGIRLLQIEVEDTGVGIAPEEISSLFEPFVQTSSGRKLQQGTGLGLAISQRFVRLMGGTIAVQSQVDHGSIFTVAIPVVLPPIPDSSPHSMTDWATADWATADWATPHQMESVSTQPYPSDLSKDELSLIGLNSTEFPQANLSPSIATLEDPVTMIEELSVEWLADLHFAALRLSSDQCLHLIQQLPTTQAELANRLNDWVDRFQFEAIIEWAEALHSSDNPKSI
jgi:nitrogen-specific signal transduction histidine kinase